MNYVLFTRSTLGNVKGPVYTMRNINISDRELHKILV